MDPTRISLFDLADRRLAWLDRRQQLLAQNIANADTPGWHARDLTPFEMVVATAAASPVRTDPRHLSGGGGATAERRVRPREIAPDGNAVAVESELTKVADTDTAQELVTTLYHRYMAMFQIALGRSS
jgi:flagellar basal-body rod protein FlgB